MKPSPLLASLLLPLVWLLSAAPAAEPVFLARTAAGKTIRGPLHKLANDWSVEIGQKLRRKIAAGDLVSLRQEGVALPPLPADEHLILANGDRLPAQDLRLDDEKLFFRHKDLDDKELSVPLSAVVVIWRTAPDRVVLPERFRRRLFTEKRKSDRVLLRNGDTLEGTFNGLKGLDVEVEANKKTSKARWAQVAAVAMSTELVDRLRPKGLHARVVLTDKDGGSGGRMTLTTATCDGILLRGRTVFGALVRIPIERVVALDVLGGKAVDLSDLPPAKYEYHPYLDEKWGWSADGNVLGRDLRLGGSTYDKGIGMHAHSALTWSLAGAYKRFEARVGLDDACGRKGRVRVRVLVDGKAGDPGRKEPLTHASGPLAVSVDVQGAKTLTLEVENAEEGVVQGVVDWVEARLIK
jgi:hypothetical protein